MTDIVAMVGVTAALTGILLVGGRIGAFLIKIMERSQGPRRWE